MLDAIIYDVVPKKMTSYILYILVLVCCVSCVPKDSAQIRENTSEKIIYPFYDSTYQLSFRLFENTAVTASDESQPNALLVFKKAGPSADRIVFQDTITSLHLEFLQADMNGDHINDVMVFHTTGVRANPRYYLYLVDSATKSLKRLPDFEKLPNPQYDSSNNLILSVGLAGGNQYYRFYRISGGETLKDLGHSFSIKDSASDSLENVVKSVVLEHGR